MAYGLRARIEYKDINNVLTRIDFEHEGFAGVADVRYANAGIEIKYGDSGTTQLPLVYGSQITVYFDAESDYEFLDFFTANSRKTKILTYKNDVLKHVAFGEADTWHEPLIAAPYGVSLTGYDGLGLLKDEDFLNADKTPYEGEKTPIEILTIILGKTGLALPVNTAVGLRPAGTTGDPLLAVLKDVVSYAGKSCYEVLEMLFRGCRIFQRNGEWWVISNDKWTGTSISCYHYTAAGVADGTVNINTEITGFWFENEASFDYMPAMKEMKVTQIFGYKPNLLKNSDFEEINEAGNFDNWTAVGVVPQQRVYDADGNKFVYLPGVERLDPWDTANRTKYLVSDSVIVSQASDIFNVKLSYALMGPEKSSAYVFFGLFLEGDNGTDYALEAYYYTETDVREVRHRWTVNSHKLAVPVKAHIKRNRVFLGADTFEVEPDRIESYPYDDVMNHFATATIAVEGGIPTTGTIRVYLFLAHTGSIVAGSCFREIRMFITDEEQQELPTQTEFSIINDPGNNYVPDDLELVNGDLPNIPNRMTVYDGGFILNDGSEEGTLLWTLDGKATTYTYAELIARLIAAEMKLARQAYQARLADAIPSTAMVFADTNNSGKRFVEAGVTYDDRMQAIEGRYIEVKDFDIDSFTVGSVITYADKGENSSSNPAKVIDTDERVKLIDPVTRNVEGQPGYLNALQFTQEIDTETGRAVISVNDERARIFDVENQEMSGLAGYLSSQDFTHEIDPASGFTIIRSPFSWTEIITSISNIPSIIASSFGFFKESFLIENTTDTGYTQLSSWFVIAYNELVGNFKAVVMIHDKVTHTAVTLQNTFGFDYTDAANEVGDDNAIISDGSITLVLSVDAATKRLKAVVSGMTSNGKRIHFCFERCVLGIRAVETSGEMGLNVGMEATGQQITEIEAVMGMGIGMTASMNEVLMAELHMGLNLGMTAEGSTEVPVTEIKLGLIYNGFVHRDERKLTSSDDWHVITQPQSDLDPDSDWDIIYGYSGPGYANGSTAELKETGTIYWDNPNTGATNSKKFNARAGGFRLTNGTFNYKGIYAVFGDGGGDWTWGGFSIMQYNSDSSTHWGGFGNNAGGYIRLVNRNTILLEGEEGVYVGNDEKIYRTVCINGIEVLADNLAETRFRNGENIPEVTNNTTWSGLSTSALCAYDNDWNNV